MGRLRVGDTIRLHEPFPPNTNKIRVGIIIEVYEPQIYDRGRRILIIWQGGGFSYEKESMLRKLN
jgi:hypothetical protein